MLIQIEEKSVSFPDPSLSTVARVFEILHGRQLAVPELFRMKSHKGLVPPIFIFAHRQDEFTPGETAIESLEGEG